jgi:peptidyl-prolyl cis-trans isomerase C
MSTRSNTRNRAKFRHNRVGFKALENPHWRVSMLFSYRHGAFAKLALSVGLAALIAGSARAEEPAAAPAAETAPAAAAAPAEAVDPAKVVATIDGQAVTEGELALALSSVDQQYAQLAPEQRRAAAFMAVMEIKLLVAKAVADGLDKDPEVEQRLAFLHDRALHGEVIEKNVADSITEADIRARYDKTVSETPPVNEVKARHILVKTEEEAREIIKQLDEGADFEKLANEKTLDPSGKTSGGDLGYFTASQMVPEFSEAAMALDIGAYSKEPVKTDFGWHIIKLEDKRAQQPPAYEQVKSRMNELLLREKYFALVNDLRAAAKVEIADEELKKAIDAIDAAQKQ